MLVRALRSALKNVKRLGPVPVLVPRALEVRFTCQCNHQPRSQHFRSLCPMRERISQFRTDRVHLRTTQRFKWPELFSVIASWIWFWKVFYCITIVRYSVPCQEVLFLHYHVLPPRNLPGRSAKRNTRLDHDDVDFTRSAFKHFAISHGIELCLGTRAVGRLWDYKAKRWILSEPRRWLPSHQDVNAACHGASGVA